MPRKKKILISLGSAILLCFAVACSPQPERIVVTIAATITPTIHWQPQNQTAQPEQAKQTEPSRWMGVIHCPECEGIGLILWQKIDDIGNPAGKVYHGDTCEVIDRGVTDGIEKYKLNCLGKYGWLRAEEVIPK